MEDDRDVAGDLVEPVLEPQAQVLERVEHAVRAGEIGVVVARGEAQRVGLDPGHLDASAVFVADGDMSRPVRLLAGPGALSLELEFGSDSHRGQHVVRLLETRRR